MSYQTELMANKYAQAVLAVRGRFEPEQLHRAAWALFEMDSKRPKPMGEQHLIQEAGKLLRGMS